MYLDNLKTTLAVRNAALYLAEAAERHPELRTHHTVEAVLELLGKSGKRDYDLRDAVLLALIAEYQRTTGAVAQFWSYLLLRTFLSALASMARAMIPTPILDDDDREALAVLAFLEVSRRFDCASHAHHVGFALRVNTWHQLLRLVGRELSYDEGNVPMEDEHIEMEMLDRGLMDRGPGHFRDQLSLSAPQLRTLLFRWLGKSFPAQDLELIADTVLSGKEVSSYVRERHTQLEPQEQRRLENRVNGKQSRLLVRMRATLAERFVRDQLHARMNPAIG